MEVPTGNIISKNRISKYKELEIEIEKMWHFKTTTVPVIVEKLVMNKKGTDKHTNKIPGSPSQDEILKKSSLLIQSTIKVTEKYRPKEAVKNINT